MGNSSKIQFTPKQQKVIDQRHANILVSAAAGSGKTEVLTQRIVSIISDEKSNIDIDRMLILTFTKAAASEMRERIGKELSKRLSENPEDDNLWRQSVLLQNAQISTIDSFCLFVVRNNFADISLDPGFRIMDEGEEKLMQKDAVREVLDNHFNDSNNLEFKHLIDCYCNPGKDDVIEDILISLYNFVMSDPDYDEWIEKAADLYNINNSEEILASPLWQKYELIVESMIRENIKLLLKAQNMCQDEDGPQAYSDTINDYYYMAEALIATKSYEKRYHIFEAFNPKALGRGKGKNEDAIKRENVKKIRDQVKKQFDNIKNDFYPNPEQLVENSQYVNKALKELLILLKELVEVLGQKKREANVLSFADMEHYALDILTKKENGVRVPSQSALEYRDFFDVIMVDEYQDSNYVQEYILKSIAREDNYFMVGDIKQSIYAFRQATPEIFASKYNSFSEDGINCRIDLNSNFRSRDEVVDFVNAIFENLMNTFTSSVEYDENAALKREAVYPENIGCETEVLLLEKGKNDDLEESDNLRIPYKAEGVMIAQKIKELFDTGFMVTDKKTRELRRLKYSDIVILVRSTRGINTVFSEVLESFGIPSYIDTKTGYFATYEIRTLLNYLMVLDNPRQDIPLFAVMVSFIGDFTDEEVATIKGENADLELYDAICAYDENDLLYEKINKLLSLIDSHRELTKYLGIRKILEKILEDTSFKVYMQAFCEGDKRVANIDALLDKATDFENSSMCGLFHFVKYIEQLKARDVDFGEAGMIDENADAVRIMTIHGSKGLEFPICFVSAVGKKFNQGDSRSSIIYNRDAGIGLDYINPKTREKRNTLQKKLIAKKIKEDNISEEIRVLYVALTRAKEKLIITGEYNGAEEYLETLKEKDYFSDFDVLSMDTYMNMILWSLAKKRVLDKYVNVKCKDELIVEDVKSSIKTHGNISSLLNHEYEVEDELINEIMDNINSDYGHKELKGLYVKTSVSELKKAAYEELEINNLNTMEHVANEESPFIEGGSKGAKYGSAMHRIMELISFKDIVNNSDKTSYIRNIIAENIVKGRLDKESAELISASKVIGFFDTSLGKRMANAEEHGLLYREKSFFYGIDANRVKKEFPQNEMMLVQGVVDVYFEENDGIVVVDYKTDKVQTEEELKKRYKVQLDLYAEALSRILDKTVKEKIIYSFSLKKVITL